MHIFAYILMTLGFPPKDLKQVVWDLFEGKEEKGFI